jgi:hypothetical protein
MIKKVTFHRWEDGNGIIDLGPDARYDTVEDFRKAWADLKPGTPMMIGGADFTVVEHAGMLHPDLIVNGILDSFLDTQPLTSDE